MGRKKGNSKASTLLKTMGRGSPRTRAPEEDPPAATPEPETAARAMDGDVVRASTPAGARTSGRPSAAKKRTGSQPAQPVRAKRRERPAKPVRITVDLDTERHRFLRDFAYREDARGTEVVRALLDELNSDADLVERVRDRLTAGE